MRRITGILHDDVRTLLMVSRRILLGIRNVSNKMYSENQKTYFIFKLLYFCENRAVFEIMWKNVVQPGRPQVNA